MLLDQAGPLARNLKSLHVINKNMLSPTINLSQYEEDPYKKAAENLLRYGHYDWDIVYEDYMSPEILGFTNLRRDIHLPRTPRHYALNVIPHEKTHNILQNDPYVVRSDGSHDEDLIDHYSRNGPVGN